MAKQIGIRCPPHVGQLVVDSLCWFIERNYPAGTDECSIAARDALYDLVDLLQRELLSEGRTTYSIRMRAFLCEAVRSYLAFRALETGTRYDSRCQVLIDVCRGNSEGLDFDAAAQRDAAMKGTAPEPGRHD